MKKFIYFGIAISLFSCKDAIKSQANSEYLIAENIKFEEPTINSNLTITTKGDLLGYWVGQFKDDMPQNENEVEYIDEDFYGIDYEYNKKITFSIDKIKGTEIIRHSIVSGNIQKFIEKMRKNQETKNRTGNFCYPLRKMTHYFQGNGMLSKKLKIKSIKEN